MCGKEYDKKRITMFEDFRICDNCINKTKDDYRNTQLFKLIRKVKGKKEKRLK